PTFYARVLAAGVTADAMASVRACVSAGERLPAEVYRAWREAFGLEILDGIGATETIFMVLSSRAGASRPGTTGGPVPGSEARLLDAEGRLVAAGQQGVLWVKTPSVAAGYWGRPEDTRRAFDGEWFRFGDVYYVDADGHWVHCGRQDDLFKVAGQWVIPSGVEAVALRHPGVLEAGLVGAEEGTGLIKPFLFVVPRPEAGDAAQLTAELGERLAREVPTYARPREVRVVAELPRTTTGKLQRHLLRRLVGIDRRAAAEGEASGKESPPSIAGPRACAGARWIRRASSFTPASSNGSISPRNRSSSRSASRGRSSSRSMTSLACRSPSRGRSSRRPCVTGTRWPSTPWWRRWTRRRFGWSTRCGSATSSARGASSCAPGSVGPRSRAIGSARGPFPRRSSKCSRTAWRTRTHETARGRIQEVRPQTRLFRGPR